MRWGDYTVSLALSAFTCTERTICHEMLKHFKNRVKAASSPPAARVNNVVKSQPLSPRPALRDAFMQVKNFMSVPEELSTIDPSEVANLSQTYVQIVRADLVRMYHADAEVVTAAEAELRRSAVGNLKADHVDVRKSLLATVNATEISAERSVTGYVQAEKASVSGYTGAVVARSAEVQQGITGLVAGTDIHVEGGRTVLLVGRSVTGNVTTLMDSRSALIAGLTGGLFAGLLLLLGRLLFGRK